MIAITGVNGLIGCNLARTLIARGLAVRGIIHQGHQAVDGLDMELVTADVLDPDSLIRALHGVEVVYHLAGMISLSGRDDKTMHVINVEGVRNVLAACKASKIHRLVHFSSIHALVQEPFNRPVDEQRPLATSSMYTGYIHSKAAGETLVRQAIAGGLDGVILNPTAVFGPYDFHPSYFGQALILMANGRLPAQVRGGFDWVDVRDVVETAIRAAQSAPAGSRFLLSGHWRSVAQVARSVASLTGVHPPRFEVPLGLAYSTVPLVELFARLAGTRPLYTRVSLEALQSNQNIRHDLATQMFDYNPRPFDESLANTIEWFTRAGFINSNPRHP